jgi:hypothetical protein
MNVFVSQWPLFKLRYRTDQCTSDGLECLNHRIASIDRADALEICLKGLHGSWDGNQGRWACASPCQQRFLGRTYMQHTCIKYCTAAHWLPATSAASCLSKALACSTVRRFMSPTADPALPVLSQWLCLLLQLHHYLIFITKD